MKKSSKSIIIMIAAVVLAVSVLTGCSSTPTEKDAKAYVQAVLDMKKINNRWSDVADQLGVDKAKLRPEGGHHGMKAPGGPQGGPPPAMMGDGEEQE